MRSFAEQQASIKTAQRGVTKEVRSWGLGETALLVHILSCQSGVMRDAYPTRAARKILRLQFQLPRTTPVSGDKACLVSPIKYKGIGRLCFGLSVAQVYWRNKPPYSQFSEMVRRNVSLQGFAPSRSFPSGRQRIRDGFLTRPRWIYFQGVNELDLP